MPTYKTSLTNLQTVTNGIFTLALTKLSPRYIPFGYLPKTENDNADLQKGFYKFYKLSNISLYSRWLFIEEGKIVMLTYKRGLTSFAHSQQSRYICDGYLPKTRKR